MAGSSRIEMIESVKFKGDVRDGKNLSAVGRVGNLLLVAGDEDDRIQVLRRDGKDYKLLGERGILLNDEEEEADVEGIACEGDVVHVVASHGAKRKKLKETDSRAKNRERLESPEPPSPFRSILARFRLQEDGKHSDMEMTTLRPLIDSFKVLQPFVPIPCKENGIDVEGLSVRGGRLMLGFRGPVLQHGFVPVLDFRFAGLITGGELVYLNLDGRGVRDLERVDDGFLVLAGPVSDVDLPFRVYRWDGLDCVPGNEGGTGELELLGELSLPDGAKAEGLTLEAESATHYTVLVLCDGLKEGGPTRFAIRKT